MAGWPVVVLVIALAVAVGLLVTIGVAEVRSRRGEVERVETIRLRLAAERRQARLGVGSGVRP